MIPKTLKDDKGQSKNDDEHRHDNANGDEAEVTRNGLGDGAIVESDPFILHVGALGPRLPIVIVDVVAFATLKF